MTLAGDIDDILIRPATRSDARRMGAIYVAAWRETYASLLPAMLLVNMSAERHAAQFAHAISAATARNVTLIAEDSHRRVVGFAGAGPSRHAPDDGQSEIYTLYVDPNHVGDGIGRALMSAAFTRLAGLGFSSAIIWALKGNPARYFYLRMGGRFTAHRDARMGGQAIVEEGFHFTFPQLRDR